MADPIKINNRLNLLNILQNSICWNDCCLDHNAMKNQSFFLFFILVVWKEVQLKHSKPQNKKKR